MQTLFQQQFLLGAVAADNRGVRQHLAQLLADLAILVDDLDLRAGGQQTLGQVIGHAATAENHHLTSLLALGAHGAQQLNQLAVLGGDADAVAVLQDEITARNKHLFPSLHHADQEGGLEFTT